jgi:peroxiredoxin
MIKIGEHLPEATFRVKDDEGNVKKLTTSELFDGKKVVLVGVPGAFTSTCHKAHVPTFVANASAIKAKGVDRIIVISNNDHHVMKAWADTFGPGVEVDFIADGSSEFGKAIGALHDGTHVGMGPERYDRFSMIVNNRVVKQVNAETDHGKVSVSGAATVLGQL